MECGSPSILLIANNNWLLCTSLADLLISSELYRSVDVAENSGTANALNVHQYGLIIYFASYPLTCLSARVLKLTEAKLRVLLVLHTEDKFAMHQIRKLSVDGLISIGASSQEFLSAVATIARRGLKYISPLLISSISPSILQSDTLSNLSRKEFDVAVGILRGIRNVEIARQLNISQKTVNTYKSRIYKKLEIESDMQLLRHAFNSGLLKNGLFAE